MKQLILKSFSVFFALLLFGMQSFALTLKASNSTPITTNEIQSVSEFDDSEIYNAFAEVAELDQYLAENAGKTYNEVKLDNSTLLNGISSTTSLPLSASSDELALGIPSFLWGCVFGVVGLLVVYLVCENKEQTKKALWGCVVSTVITTALYVVVIAAEVGSTSTY
jgi:hypothetical protein